MVINKLKMNQNIQMDTDNTPMGPDINPMNRDNNPKEPDNNPMDPGNNPIRLDTSPMGPDNTTMDPVNIPVGPVKIPIGPVNSPVGTVNKLRDTDKTTHIATVIIPPLVLNMVRAEAILNVMKRKRMSNIEPLGLDQKIRKSMIQQWSICNINKQKILRL